MKKYVMLIDEDPVELEAFMKILKSINDSFRCKYAPTGKQAIEMLQHSTPDYIFIDYELTEIDALQLLSVIRFQSKLKQTKVYLYSDHISDDSSKMARMLGATGCIEKAAEFSNLVHKFKAIFSPELLPSYVFLKDTRSVRFFSIPDFLDIGLPDEENHKERSKNLEGNPGYHRNQLGRALDNDHFQANSEKI